MSFELSENDKKSLAITTVVYALLLLLLFLLRFWPPANMKLMGGGGGGGIEMNFGDSDYGMGDNYKSEVLNAANQAKATPTTTTPDEDVISDDTDDETNVAIPKKDNVKAPVVPKKDVKPVPQKPKVSQNANDALSSILNGNRGGDGNDTRGGNKGSANGNLNSNGYYGNGSGTGSGGGNGSGNGTGSGSGTGSGNGSGSGGGNGSGAGYSLGNRKNLNKPAPENPCGNESGRVAVEVKVDRSGNTVSVRPGVQGTTNSNSCLLEQARKAAMQTKWTADNNAAEIQVGKIIYVFTLN